ncbi:porin family protein [Roseateles amylovorans]|uniref:Porin family protein n=1 Tax=Roseateles amylovorans TaxID=2978473 RepID=A0ABY6AWE2_9BURK|nr:porin family protein [Roseateles amylovorans]UXH77292.1 porin family protein [Roseateles amylovorans]
MKKISVIAAALLLAGAAQAQSNTSAVYGEVGYTFVTIDAGTDLEPGMLRGIVGWNVHPNLAIEGMLATGVKDDNTFGLKTKVSRAYGVYLKPKYDFGNGFEVFGRLGYADLKLKQSFQGASGTDSGNDVSYGVGASYSFNKNVYGTVDYMSYYDKDGVKGTGFTLGVGYRF